MEYEVNPKNKSPKIKIGTKIFAFIGIGGKSNINRALGNKKAKATKTPYKAPEAPTMTPLKADKPLSNFSLPSSSTMEKGKSLVLKKLVI